ncbi:MAG: tRNA (adenine(22)-N(1))-methyltransferase [Eubacterium sp.]
MNISYRLKKVADMVTSGNRLADIGTDHGYVPIYLVKNKIIPSAIAMDINKGPLSRAAMHIREEGINCIETRLSDGLENLKPGEVDTILIAGMGGELMIRILQSGSKVLESVKEIILSPHSEWFQVRKYLLSCGYEIINENIITDQGKYYIIIKAEKTGKYIHYNTEELKYGKILIDSRNEVLKEYLCRERDKCDNILSKLQDNKGSGLIRKHEIENTMYEIDSLLKEW